MESAKFMLCILATMVVVLVAGLVITSVQPQYYTGTDIGPASNVSTSQTMTIQADVPYTLTATNCHPFTVTVDDEKLDGQPQDPKGSDCTSYYKVESEFTAKSVKLTTGTADVSVHADKPVSLTIAYSDSTTSSVTGTAVLVGFWLWVLLMALVINI